MKRIALAVAVLLVALGAVSGASASSLVVQGGVIQPLAAGRPCADGATATAPVATTTAQTQVRLTVPADCVGRTVQATVVDAAGVPHSSAPTVLTAVTQDVAVGAYTAAATMQVGAAVDGWGLATTWSWTPPRLPVTCRIPSNPAQTCTATLTSVTDQSWFLEPDRFSVGVTVTSTSPSPVPWELTFDFSHPAFPGVPSQLRSTAALGAPSACAQLPLYTVRGSGTSNAATAFRNVSQTQSRSLTLVADSWLAWDTPVVLDC